MTQITSFARSGLDLDALHRALLDAFSDYLLPLQPDADSFRATLRARGFDPEASQIALDQGDIAAFWNVATRNDNRYLISSGTRISHRRQGLAARLGQAAIAAATGAQTFWLEVIEGNTSARRLYETLGFEVTRKLDCYRLDHPSPRLSPCHLADVPTVATTINRHATWPPTWQNTTETIVTLPLTAYLHDQGGIILGTGGLVHQLAASTPAALSELLAAAATQGPLTLVNLDATDTALKAVLEDLGVHRFVTQAEMRLSLPQAA